MGMNWQKFLDLVKKTGDRLIVTDRDEGEAYVVMSLSEYEDLISRLHEDVRYQEAEPIRHHDETRQSEDFSRVPAQEFDEPPLTDEERFYLEPIE